MDVMMHQEQVFLAGMPGIWVVIGAGFGNFRVSWRFFENFSVGAWSPDSAFQPRHVQPVAFPSFCL
jgi:hypothetical protein